MSYASCLQHGPVALASSQTQPHFIWDPLASFPHLRSNSGRLVISAGHRVHLVLDILTQCFIPDPTSLRSVKSLYFKLNAKSQTQPHLVRLGLCISNSMLHPKPNLKPHLFHYADFGLSFFN
ncbi:hypothetical protein E4T56_gene887 [Termitomyces sp. T112]|nr:hypothetical protein E4T56_gene887 [Termitomyces sp. T112]